VLVHRWGRYTGGAGLLANSGRSTSLVAWLISWDNPKSSPRQPGSLFAEHCLRCASGSEGLHRERLGVTDNTQGVLVCMWGCTEEEHCAAALAAGDAGGASPHGCWVPGHASNVSPTQLPKGRVKEEKNHADG